jgi:hypothetical protein
MTSVAAYGLDFVLFFTSHEVRWWSGVVGAVFYCFDIWGKEGRVEYRVDIPLVGEFQFVRHRGDGFCDFEGSMSSGCEFYCSIG